MGGLFRENYLKRRKSSLPKWEVFLYKNMPISPDRLIIEGNLGLSESPTTPQKHPDGETLKVDRLDMHIVCGNGTLGMNNVPGVVPESTTSTEMPIAGVIGWKFIDGNYYPIEEL